MKTLFLLSMVMALVFSCFGCVDPKINIQAPASLTGMSSAAKSDSIVALSHQLADAQKQLEADKVKVSNLKKQIKDAQTVKMQHEFYIAGGIFGLVLAGCAFLFFWSPSPNVKKYALRGIWVCGIFVALSCVAAKVVPYRTWIEVILAVLAASYAAFYAVKHHITSLNELKANIAVLEGKLNVAKP